MPTPLWGPDDTAAQDASGALATDDRPEERKWGAGSVAMIIGLLLITQVLFAVGLIAYVLATNDLNLDNPDAVDALLDETTNMLLSGPALISALVVQWLAFIGGPWLATRFFGLKSLRRDFGVWFKKSDLAYGLALGLVLQAAQFVILNVVDLSESDNTSMVTNLTGIYLVLMIVGACVITPFAEELFFRGLILRAIMRTRPGGWWPVDEDGMPTGKTNRVVAVVAILVSSVVFGSMHLTTDGSLANSLPLMAFTGALGAVFAIVTIKTKRIGIAVVAHCVFNTFSLFAVLISEGRIF